MAGFSDLLDNEETGEIKAPPATDESVEGSQDSQESLPVIEKMVPLKALEDERFKRQNNEATVQALQRQLDVMINSLQQQNVAKKSEVKQEALPDLLLNPEEWQTRFFTAVESLMENQVFTRTLAFSEEAAREKFDDYDKLIDTYFKPAANNHPELIQGLYRAPDPAKYAYKQAKRLQRESEHGDDMDYDKLKEKLRAEIMSELEGKKAELDGKLKIPESLGAVSSSGAASNKEGLPPGGSWRPTDLYR